MWCEVGFTMCLVQMNACLKGRPIWRSFGTEQQAIMFRKGGQKKRRMYGSERERKKRVL